MFFPSSKIEGTHKDGIVFRKRANGTFYYKISSLDGCRKNGTCTWYYRNGVISERSMWENNRRVGECIKRSKNGTLIAHLIHFKDKDTMTVLDSNLSQEDKVVISLQTGAKWLKLTANKNRVG